MTNETLVPVLDLLHNPAIDSVAQKKNEKKCPCRSVQPVVTSVFYAIGTGLIAKDSLTNFFAISSKPPRLPNTSTLSGNFIVILLLFKGL